MALCSARLPSRLNSLSMEHVRLCLMQRLQGLKAPGEPAWTSQRSWRGRGKLVSVAFFTKPLLGRGRGKVCVNVSKSHLLLPALIARPLHSGLVSRPISRRRATGFLSVAALIAAAAIQQVTSDTRSLAFTGGSSSALDRAGGLTRAHRRRMAGGGGLGGKLVGVRVVERGLLLVLHGGFGVKGGRLLLPGHDD